MLEILTPSGFQVFDGVARWDHSEKISIHFDDNSQIECAKKHKFVYDNNTEVYAEHVKIGDVLGGKLIVAINIICEKDMMYDPINVENGSVYYHDDFIASTQTFFGTGDTLIDANTLMSLRSHPPLATLGDVKIYEETQKGHEYVLCADVGKGRGMDYSTFIIIDVTEKPFKQVAVYRNNRISSLLFPDIIYKWATAYNEAYVIIESNDEGIVVCNGLYHELEYENIHIESAIKANRVGVEMTKKVKRIGCSGFKSILEAGGLEIVDEETIIEISTFEARGNSFEASDGNHDDLVMNLVMFGYFAGTKFFSNMTDLKLREFLYDQRIKEIEEDIVPFGFIHAAADEEAAELELPAKNWSVVKDQDWEPFDFQGMMF